MQDQFRPAGNTLSSVLNNENHNTESKALRRFLLTLRDSIDDQLTIWITDNHRYDPLLGMAEINGTINAGALDLIDMRSGDVLKTMTDRLQDKATVLVSTVQLSSSVEGRST